MILSEKYKVVEDTMNITLYEMVKKNVLDGQGEPTGEVKVTDKFKGHFSVTPLGRSQCYSKLINCEISDSEKQGLQDILDIVKRCEEQVVDFWSKQ